MREMREFKIKYVFHIPLCEFSGDELASIEIDEILEDLINRFNDNGFDSLYVSKAEGHYKSRRFDEMLLTLFSDDDAPEAIFKDWFRQNNAILKQEAFAFECSNRMYVEKLYK